jgi:hypothetical protein
MNIIKLTASNSGGSSPLEPKNVWPTYENVVSAFKKIISDAESGERVYIHYSGHGAQLQTQWSATKAPGAKDETLVPTDIGDPNARHLRDVELAYLLDQMVEKGLIVDIVMDSCYSGGVTRMFGGPGVKYRSLTDVDTTFNKKLNVPSSVASEEKLRDTWLRISGGLPNAPTFKISTGGLGKQRGYVLLAACNQNELAIEYTFQTDQVGGLLTTIMLDELKKHKGEPVSYQDLRNNVSKRMSAFTSEQHPVVVGADTARTFFGR